MSGIISCRDNLIEQSRRAIEAQNAKPDDSNFREACRQFIGVCYKIREFTGIVSFKGGFDEYSALISSNVAVSNPAQSSLFASMWMGANEYAVYEARKIGLGQPDWWYWCWEHEGDLMQDSSSEN